MVIVSSIGRFEQRLLSVIIFKMVLVIIVWGKGKQHKKKNERMIVIYQYLLTLKLIKISKRR